MLKFYDFIIHTGYISKLFFPIQSAITSLLITFSVYAVGYLARPFRWYLLSLVILAINIAGKNFYNLYFDYGFINIFDWYIAFVISAIKFSNNNLAPAYINYRRINYTIVMIINYFNTKKSFFKVIASNSVLNQSVIS